VTSLQKKEWEEEAEKEVAQDAGIAMLMRAEVLGQDMTKEEVQVERSAKNETEKGERIGDLFTVGHDHGCLLTSLLQLAPLQP